MRQLRTPSALEVGFPAAMLSEVGLKESWRKEVHRPATATHKWWAKRLGSVFRGIIVSAFASDEQEAETLYASHVSLDGLVVLDPFAGSGTTAVEVLKLGGRIVSLDINPVATLVQRQAIQPWNIRALMDAYQRVELACRAEIDRVHRTEDGRSVLYYFWVATSSCPDCGESIRLFDSPVFAKHAYPKRYPLAQFVCPVCLDLLTAAYDANSIVCGNGHTVTQAGSVVRSDMTCSRGHTNRVIDSLAGKRPTYEMYAKLVLGFNGQKVYEPITDWDRALYGECEMLLPELPEEAVLPVGELAVGHNTNQARRWNFRRWTDFFNARQLYSLSLLATAIRDVEAPANEREALCALFSGVLEFNNLFASYKGEGTGAVRHMFAHHVLKPERTPLEAHPWGTPASSGAFSTLFESRLLRAHAYKRQPTDLVARGGTVVRVEGLSAAVESEPANTWQQFETTGARAYVASVDSAVTDLPGGCIDLVVTDPPYMDNVHYAELADFFHAWLSQLHPFSDYPINSTTRREGEVQSADPAAFGEAIGRVWAECARVLRDDGTVVFTFHQARVSGWVQLVESLRSAGLVVTAVQPVKGEMSTSIVKAQAREPSNLDSVVVCRKRDHAPTPPSIDAVFERAVADLRRLVIAGVDVGAGDVRSVVRGTLVAYMAAEVADLSTVTARVDEWADRAIEEVLAR
jgi:adenine-specific DNA methylase